MLRVAVPNKGSLAEPAADMLRESGYRQRSDPRELVLLDPGNDTEFFFLRPRDIATYVGSGELDVGITGRDLLLDSGAPAEEILPLGFGESTFRFAAKPGLGVRPSPTSPASGSPRRTAVCSRSTSPTAASRPRWSGWTARSRPRCGSVSPT